MKQPDPVPRGASMPCAQRWATPETARWYSTQRFRTRRSLERDLVVIRKLFARAGLGGPCDVLDAPSGSGRLTPLLASHARRLVAADVALPMLQEARATGQAPARLVLGDARALPFAARSFDVVLCCRFLHHQSTREELEQVLRELVRVSRGWVVASFWDRASLPALRTRLGLKPSETRTAVPRDWIRELLAVNGARALHFGCAMRWISQQTFFAARVDAAAREEASVARDARQNEDVARRARENENVARRARENENVARRARDRHP